MPGNQLVRHGQAQTDDVGLKRTWRYACLEENINPAAPSRLPLLFWALAQIPRYETWPGFTNACEATKRTAFAMSRALFIGISTWPSNHEDP